MQHILDSAESDKLGGCGVVQHTFDSAESDKLGG